MSEIDVKLPILALQPLITIQWAALNQLEMVNLTI